VQDGPRWAALHRSEFARSDDITHANRGSGALKRHLDHGIVPSLLSPSSAFRIAATDNAVSPEHLSGSSAMKTFACLVAAACVIAGVLLDYTYARSTPGAVRAHGTVVDFVRRNSRQVYPVFEFQDLEGKMHRVVNSTQQVMVRFAAGDAVSIAYSGSDPQRARIDTLWFDHRWMIAAVMVALTVFGSALRMDAARSGV
jgi:Protein of unknown function (DUF3592)